MIPEVTVPPNSPNGFPIATAVSPTSNLLDFPITAGERLLASILMTAKSVDASVPINLAL